MTYPWVLVIIGHLLTFGINGQQTDNRTYTVIEMYDQGSCMRALNNMGVDGYCLDRPTGNVERP